MRCPKCHLNHNTVITHTRHRSDGSVRRRHICLACNVRWTGLEEAVLGSLRTAPPPANLEARSRGRQ
jgi:transcriptional regulator NrdR family protein